MKGRADHIRRIVALLEGVRGGYDLRELFTDCVESIALSIANSVDLQQRDEREARYMAISKRHGPETMNVFARIFGAVVAALEDAPGDVLGQVFEELGMSNARIGQFLTPYHLALFAAEITLGCEEDARRIIEQRGFVRVQEPACGSGAMLIALTEVFGKRGFNHRTQMHVTAVDVDARAVHMAYIHLSLLYVPAVIFLGNTLSMEMRSQWFTPAHILDGWGRRLRRDQPDAQPENSEPIEAVLSKPQLALF